MRASQEDFPTPEEHEKLVSISFGDLVGGSVGGDIGGFDTVGVAVVGNGDGFGLKVGFPPRAIETSAQLKNCSGQVVPLVPSFG